MAVLGAGYWGRNLVRNVQATPGLSLRSVCDVDTARARAVLGEDSTVPVCAGPEQVLADPAVQAVAIATPVATHCELALAALEAGKHVLVEKPLAGSYADGLKMAQAAQYHGAVLMVDHTFCYTPAVAHLAGLVRRGELGEIHYIDSVRINLGLVQPDVDVLWDLAPHDLSIMDTILPQDVTPTAVAAHVSGPTHQQRPCMAYLSVALSNGALAHAHESWLAPRKVRTLVVGGSRRTAVWNDLDPIAPLVLYDRGIDWHDAAPDSPVSYRTGDMVAPALPAQEPLGAVMTEFAAAITEHRAPRTDAWAGLRVLDQLEAASASRAQDGRFVPLVGQDDGGTW